MPKPWVPGVARYATGLVLAFDDHDAARAGAAQGGGGGEAGGPAADDRDVDVGGDVVRGAGGCAAFPELIDGDGGVLCERADVRAAVEALAAAHQDTGAAAQAVEVSGGFELRAASRISPR